MVIRDLGSEHEHKAYLYVQNVPLLNSGYTDLCYIKDHRILQLFLMGRISQITVIASGFFFFSLTILNTLQALAENQSSFKL